MGGLRDCERLFDDAGFLEELRDLLVSGTFSSCLRPEPLCRVLRFLLSRWGDVVIGSCAPQWQLRKAATEGRKGQDSGSQARRATTQGQLRSIDDETVNNARSRLCGEKDQVGEDPSLREALAVSVPAC